MSDVIRRAAHAVYLVAVGDEEEFHQDCDRVMDVIRQAGNGLVSAVGTAAAAVGRITEGDPAAGPVVAEPPSPDTPAALASRRQEIIRRMDALRGDVGGNHSATSAPSEEDARRSQKQRTSPSPPPTTSTPPTVVIIEMPTSSEKASPSRSSSWVVLPISSQDASPDDNSDNGPGDGLLLSLRRVSLPLPVDYTCCDRPTVTSTENREAETWDFCDEE